MINKIKDRFSFVRLYEIIDLVYTQGEKIKQMKAQEKTWKDKFEDQARRIELLE